MHEVEGVVTDLEKRDEGVVAQCEEDGRDDVESRKDTTPSSQLGDGCRAHLSAIAKGCAKDDVANDVDGEENKVETGR